MKDKITVYYDGACPSCQKDRRTYERLTGKNSVHWCDISCHQDTLKDKGIHPDDALMRLHIETEQGEIISDIESYFILLEKVVWLRPFLWIINRPWLKNKLRKHYHRWVHQRLQAEGRLPENAGSPQSRSKTDQGRHIF